MRRIFADIYNVKRLQPGTVTVSGDPDKLLRHGCSTLGGNSGSPVTDLETHQVLGLLARPATGRHQRSITPFSG